MTSAHGEDPRELLDRLERYYDAVPRSAARVEDLGPLTLFVREGDGLPFYGRPAAGWSGPVSAADVTRLLERQRELGVPEAVEWVAETTPALRTAVEQAGLVVHEHPLMVRGPDATDPATATPGLPERTDHVVLRILGPDDPALPSAVALLYVAFGAPGTQVGAAGAAELDAATRDRLADGSVKRMAARIEAGLTRVAAAVEDGRAVCSGWHQPVGTVSEVVGLGTLPVARRRGLGLGVTAVLVDDALSRGVETVFLSASDDDVARLYSRLGFRRVATALIAEAAE